jgi:hypothetical protein
MSHKYVSKYGKCEYKFITTVNITRTQVIFTKLMLDGQVFVKNPTPNFINVRQTV